MCARRAGEGIMAYNSDIVGYFGALFVLGVMLARISQLVAYQESGCRFFPMWVFGEYQIQSSNEVNALTKRILHITITRTS